MSEQEQSQEQDRRGSEAWHPPGYTDSEAWRGSARVAWRQQWGLVACIGLPPPNSFSGLCCRPAGRAKSYFPHPHLPLPAFVTRVAVWVLEAEIQDTG